MRTEAMHDSDWPEKYEGHFDPADYADFVSVEDRDDLADLELSVEPCELCGGQLCAYGARGQLVILDCAVCKGRFVMTREGGAEEGEMWDDEEEEDL